MKTHTCDCNKTMDSKHFKYGETVHFCMDCNKYISDKEDCEHDLQPVVYILSNGAKMIKKTCTKCSFRQKQPEKMVNYNISLLPVKNNEQFHNEIALSRQEMHDLKTLLHYSRKEDFAIGRKNDYDEYLKSDEWKEKRLTVMLRDKYTCQICKEKATDVHHLTYKNFKKEYLFELVALCRNCHSQVYHNDKI